MFDRLKFLNMYKNISFEYEEAEDAIVTSIYCVEVYDVLNNEEMSKLVRKLHSLKKGKGNIYSKDVVFKKPGFKANYVSIETSSISATNVGTIIFTNDTYIKKIQITMTQLSNSEFLIDYDFYLNKQLKTDVDRHDFVVNNLSILKTNKSICTWYKKEYFNDSLDKEEYLRVTDELFKDYFQCFIGKYLYTSLGKRYNLPLVLNIAYNGDKYKEILALKPFLMKTYTNEITKEVYFVDYTTRRNGACIYRYISKGDYTSAIFKYFQYYKYETYFKFFSHIDGCEINRRLRRYFISNSKNNIQIKDHKWLINKCRGLKENMRDIPIKIGDHLLSEYKDGAISEDKILNYPQNTDRYLKIYSEYLEYINSLNNIGYSTTVLNVALATLIATLIGILIG